MVDTFNFGSSKPAVSAPANADRLAIGDESGGSYTFSWITAQNLYSNPLPIGDGTANTGAFTSLVVGGGATVDSILSTTAAVNFGSTAAGAFDDQTVTVTGAAIGSGSTVELGLPPAPPNGIVIGWVSAADTVTLRYYNSTGGTINPSAQTYRITVKTY